jgi:hypothetical protein
MNNRAEQKMLRKKHMQQRKSFITNSKNKLLLRTSSRLTLAEWNIRRETQYPF